MNEFIMFLKTFFGTPAILVGLVAMIGLILQRKRASLILTGTFKVIIGFLILGGGSGLLSGALDQFSPVFLKLFGVTGAIPNNEATLGQLLNKIPEIVSIGTGIMIVGIICNIVLALLTRYKYIYLTGHVLFYMSVMMSGALVSSGMDQSKDIWMIIIVGGVLMSMYMLLMPALNQRFMRKITKTDIIAMAHTGSLGYAISGAVGECIAKFSKKPIKSTEEIKFPQGLAFLKNSNVSIALTMIVFFMVIYIAAYAKFGLDAFIGTGVLNDKGETQNQWFVWALIQAFTFAAGTEIILLGVRMIINEIVPAFKGISEKIVKGARVGLDCAVVFTYAPNAVLIGFISSFVAGVIGMFVTYGAELPIVLPGIAAHFFLGATSGVFGNARGGVWGAIVGPFIQGFLITFVPVLFLELNGYAGAEKSVTTGWGDLDYAFGIIPLVIGRYSGKWTLFGLSIGGFIVLIVIENIVKAVKRYNLKKNSLLPNELSCSADKKDKVNQIEA